MASPAREEKQKHAYEGFGAGGKIRKTPFQRTTQATPYDWLPTILRNPLEPPTMAGSRSPSIRLSASSPPVPTSNAFLRQGVSGVLKGTIDQCSDPSHPSTTDDGGKLTDLEQIIEQKTFTRSEIDRLTALLHSRTVDMPVENLEKRSEGIPSRSAVSDDRKEEFPKTPLLDKKGIDSCLASNPVVGTSVLDEDAASPGELAKAYMGSRPSEVSLSVFGLRSQTHHEDSRILSSVPFPSKSPMMSIVPRNSDGGMFPLMTYFGQCTISFKFLDNAHNKCNSKLDVSAGGVIPDARDFTSQKQDKVTEKKCAFKMSVHEDFLDLDDDDDSSTKNIPVYSEVKTSPTVFAAGWRPGKSPVFATAFNSTSSSTGLSNVASSVAPATNSGPTVCGGSSVAAATSTNSVPLVFGGSSTAAATTNNVPSVFGGFSSAAASGFGGTLTAPAASPFQFGG